MRRGIFIFLVIVSACSSVKYLASDGGHIRLSLNFKNCGESLPYDSISIQLSPGYALSKVRDHYGFCEYQLKYPNGPTIYVSSNINYGSKLNYRNRLEIGIETYSENRSLGDTIEVGGEQVNGLFWKESIRGSFVIGYIDASDTLAFKKMIKNIELVNQ